MTERKTEAQDDKTAVTATPEAEAAPKAELADGQLEKVSGGLWPYVQSSSAYNKTI